MAGPFCVAHLKALARVDSPFSYHLPGHRDTGQRSKSENLKPKPNTNWMNAWRRSSWRAWEVVIIFELHSLHCLRNCGNSKSTSSSCLSKKDQGQGGLRRLRGLKLGQIICQLRQNNVTAKVKSWQIKPESEWLTFHKHASAVPVSVSTNMSAYANQLPAPCSYPLSPRPSSAYLHINVCSHPCERRCMGLGHANVGLSEPAELRLWVLALFFFSFFFFFPTSRWANKTAKGNCDHKSGVEWWGVECLRNPQIQSHLRGGWAQNRGDESHFLRATVTPTGKVIKQFPLFLNICTGIRQKWLINYRLNRDSESELVGTCLNRSKQVWTRGVSEK